MVCAICGQEISLDNNEQYYLLPTASKESICQQCKDQIDLFLNTPYPESMLQARASLRMHKPTNAAENYLNQIFQSRSIPRSEASKAEPEEESGAWSNVGEKIKAVARIFCWIEIIAFVLAGLILLFSNSRYNPTGTLGLICLIAGPLVSWLSSLITYGFGELISEVKKSNQLMKKMPNNK